MSGIWAWLTDPAHWTGEDGIPNRTLQQLVISGEALLLAMIFALPLALILGHFRRGGTVLVAVGNVGRAIPTYAAIVTFALTDQIGVGTFAVVLGLAVFALPPLLVNTYVAVTEVDRDAKDAAKGMGMTGGQVLRKVEVPLAFPLIFAGISITTVQVVATATFGALVGAGTLGLYITQGQQTQNYSELYSGVILVAVLCVVLDRLLALVQRLVARRTGRGVRRDRRISPAEAASPIPVHVP
jgi:osmoprotectant transport system permease protein